MKHSFGHFYLDTYHIYRCWFQRSFFGDDVLRRMVFGDGAYLAVNPILNLIKVLSA